MAFLTPPQQPYVRSSQVTSADNRRPRFGVKLGSTWASVVLAGQQEEQQQEQKEWQEQEQQQQQQERKQQQQEE